MGEHWIMHPLVSNLSQLKETELENKLQELSRRYFQVSNPAVQQQIVMIMEDYKQELAVRRQKMWQEQYQKRDTDLDSLINVS
jgi:flagellin-specific chaperone FliS